MSRSAKQFFYGALYLALAALIAISVVPRGDVAEVPASAPEGIRGLEVRGAVTTMTAADGSVAFLARVENPNTMHVAEAFGYSFRITQEDGTVVETPRRTGAAYPRETTVLLETIPSATFTEGTRITLSLGAPAWASAQFLVRPVLEFSRTETASDDLGAFVEGEVRNAGAIAAASARIIAIMRDVNGFPLFAAQTILENVSGGAMRSFFIRFPRDQGIPTRASPEGAELIIEAY